ncbi:hypothetical protein LCGC14_3116660 [marine sediment metagenome]|uniref:Uncharacterized protein n=1 Tax=marine sediment metagenome TaxID=412755 RepID=A0A0F8W3U5_9ZZZZ
MCKADPTDLSNDEPPELEQLTGYPDPGRIIDCLSTALINCIPVFAESLYLCLQEPPEPETGYKPGNRRRCPSPQPPVSDRSDRDARQKA